MKRWIKMSAAAVAATLAASPLAAGELTYQPTNPSFGGNPLNGDFLLQSAQTQNQHQDDGGGYTRPDPIDQFAGTLQRRLLGELSDNITQSIFGENPEESGTFEVGSTTVEFQRVGEEVELTISDPSRSKQTQIRLPAPQY